MTAGHYRRLGGGCTGPLQTLFTDTRFRWAVLLLTVAYSLNFLFWDLTLVDNFYWINRTDFYRTDFMNILSDYTLRLWLALFGRSVLAMRCLGWLFSAGSLVLMYLCVQTREQARANLYFLAAGFVFLGMGTQRMFTPDSPTVLCLTVATVCLVRYYRRVYGSAYYVLAAVGAAAACFRFPNILLFPFCAMLAAGYDLHARRVPARTLLGRAALAAVLFLVLYAALVGVLSGRTDLLAFASDGVLHHKVGPSHAFGRLIHIYKGTFFWHLSNCAALLLMFYLLGRTVRLIRQRWICLAAVPVIVAVMIRFFVINTEGYTSFWGVWVILCLLILEYTSESREEKAACVTFILLSLVGIAGSDCGMLKLAPYCAVVAPVGLAWYSMRYGQPPYFRYVLAVLLILSVTADMMDVCRHTATVNGNKCLAHIRMEPGKRDAYESILRDVARYGGDKDDNVYYGLLYGHTMYALTGSRPQWYSTFWMYKDDSAELSALVALMRSGRGRVLFDFSRSDPEYFVRHGLRLVGRTGYCNIYRQRRTGRTEQE